MALRPEWLDGIDKYRNRSGEPKVTKAEEIWITGVGAATPLGSSFKAIGDNLLAGRSGVRRVSTFPVNDHPSQIAGIVEHIPCPPDWDLQAFGRLGRLQQLSLSCCSAALRDSGWWPLRSEPRVGLILGTAGEWLVQWETDIIQGGKRIFQPQQQCQPVVAATRRLLGISGPAVSISAACASGNYALALAKRWLEMDWVDVCLAGACDMAVTPLCLASFGNLRALSRRNDNPAAASRPFDSARDGFVVGEGGAMFVLEKAAAARQRSAHVYATLAGCGASSDAHNMVIPSPDPQPAIAAMRQALERAGIGPEDVDYVNAHATSTSVGDIAEAHVLEAVFGHGVKRVPVSSTKSMTGHLLTAAAAVEALACLSAIHRQALPPTINLDNPDPECKLCHVPHQAQERRVQVAVSNSFGFGGSNTCLVLAAA
jgi:3-oxoacyl-[acyl-carrier-protein] synthase II